MNFLSAIRSSSATMPGQHRHHTSASQMCEHVRHGGPFCSRSVRCRGHVTRHPCRGSNGNTEGAGLGYGLSHRALSRHAVLVRNGRWWITGCAVALCVNHRALKALILCGWKEAACVYWRVRKLDRLWRFGHAVLKRNARKWRRKRLVLA